MAKKRPVITSPNIYDRKKTPVETPNVQYPQNRLPGNETPGNPRVSGPTLDDEQPHYYQQEIKHPKKPEIPTDDANGYRPNAGNPYMPPDTKPKLDQSNANVVDQPRMRQRRLKNLRLDRVDLVTAGANQGAHVVLHKMEDVEKRQFSQDERDRAEAAGQAMEGGGYPIKTVADLKNAIQAIGRAKNRAATIAHIKRRAAALGRSDLIPDTFKSMEKQMSDELETEEVEKMESPTPNRVRKISKAQESLRKALEVEQEVRKSLEERLAKMEGERREAEFIAKARELGNLGNAGELGKLMLEVNKSVSPESYQALERLLKAANAQLEKGDLFATLGRVDAENPTVEDRINELAKAKVAAGQAKTIEIAKMDVLHENPDLRTEYLNARRA